MKAPARAIVDIKAPATMEVTVYEDFISGAVITGDPSDERRRDVRNLHQRRPSSEALAPERPRDSRSRSRSSPGDSPSSAARAALHRWYVDRHAVMRRDTGGKGKRQGKDGDAATGAGKADAATGAGKVDAATGAGKSKDAGKDKGIVDAATGDGKGKGSDGKGTGGKDKDAAKDKDGDGDGKGNDGKGKDGKHGTDKGIGKDTDAGKGTFRMAITVPVPEDTVPEDTVRDGVLRL